jgi:hypothetical protein
VFAKSAVFAEFGAFAKLPIPHDFEVQLVLNKYTTGHENLQQLESWQN